MKTGIRAVFSNDSVDAEFPLDQIRS